MSDTKNKEQQKETNKGIADAKKVSLVELIMILLLVGLVFVFFFGMKELKLTKKMEAQAQSKFEAFLPILKNAIAAAEAYKQKDDFGEYPFDIQQMNITTTENEDFILEYDGEGYTFRATSKKAFGKEGIVISYSMDEKLYKIEDPKPDRKPVIKDEWLPQE